MTVRVSTIIPAFNSAATLPIAIDSALAQEFHGQEIIVVNDGSTDATAAILAGYGDRIIVIDQPNRGVAAARNAGVKAGSGEYLAFLDADDFWMPGRLARTVAALDANQDKVLAFSNLIAIESSGERRTIISGPAPSMEDLLGSMPRTQVGTWLIRRGGFEQCGGFYEEFCGGGGEDLYLFLRARELGEFEFIAEPLVVFRANDPNLGPDKWNPDNFLRQIARRYGARARGLIQEVRGTYAHAFAAKALREMSKGNRAEAIRCWRNVLRYAPHYPFQAAHLGRLVRPSNIRRMARMFMPKPRSE